MANHFPFLSTEPRHFAGGDLWRASLANFPVLNGIAIQALNMLPGAIREPHVHPNAHQLDYCIAGKATVGIVGPNGETQYLELVRGDISFVPQGYLHWIENIGNGNLEFLVALSHAEPETIELSSMLRGVPGAAIQKMFGLAPTTFASIPPAGLVVVA